MEITFLPNLIFLWLTVKSLTSTNGCNQGEGVAAGLEGGVGGKEGAERCSGRESDGLNDTCTLGGGWSRTELDHDD